MKKIKDIKIAIVSSIFRREVSEALEKNALKVFKEKGLTKDQVEIFQTPGSWEIPVVVKKLAKSKKYDAILTFGAIVKGDTYHFEQISNECARALMDISIQFEVPVVFEVLSVYDLKDALIRATRKVENKGEEAAHIALEMINTLSKIK